MPKDLQASTSRAKHYGSIDGLRALSCIGIILMHVQANTSYDLAGSFAWDTFIPSLTWLVYLFFMISGFGMCAGYLRRFQNREIDLECFYKRRYGKILPFFGLLLVIDILMERTPDAIYEASVEGMLLHGLLPNNAVSVIGVAWFLGVVFLFYLLFPAFTVLMKSKKRAWASLALSLWLVVCLNQYFFSPYFVTNSFTPRHSFLYVLPLFILGGIVYLYRDDIARVCEGRRIPALVLCLAATVLWYAIPGQSRGELFYLKSLVLFGLWLSYAIGNDSKFLASRPVRYLSSFSMELYLAQMLSFRVVERAHLLYVFGSAGTNGWLSFVVASCFTVAGLIVFIETYKWAVRHIKARLGKAAH